MKEEKQNMKKVTASCILGISVLVILVVLGTVIFAQEQKSEVQQPTSVIIMGELKLKDGADPASAEKLFYEQLIPAMKDMKGIRMRVIKKMPLPNEKEDPNAYDYIMMAEVDDPMILMQLMQSQNMDPKLSEFGKMMKLYAGEPHLKAFTVIADTVSKDEQ
jgi:hypothetical protein